MTDLQIYGLGWLVSFVLTIVSSYVRGSRTFTAENLLAHSVASLLSWLAVFIAVAVLLSKER